MINAIPMKQNIHCPHLLTNGDGLQINQVCKLLVIFHSFLLSLIQTDTVNTQRERERERERELRQFSIIVL